jgi:hypothetical protein
MDFPQHAGRALDTLLITFFRLPDDAIIGFYLGAFVLAALIVVLGDLSQALAHRINLSHFQNQDKDMVHLHNLSITALRQGDKENYKAANKLANDTFGKAFFTRAALFTVSIWPLPFAMGWLAERFQGVDIPLPMLDKTVGYNAVFLPMYILTRIAYSLIKPRIGLMRRLDPALGPPPPGMEKPISWGEVLREVSPPKKGAAGADHGAVPLADAGIDQATPDDAPQDAAALARK